MDPVTMAAIASRAAPVIGKLFGGGGQTQTNEILNKDQIQRGQKEADLALDSAKGFGPFTGPNFAGMTPEQIEALRRTGRFANVNEGLGQGLVDQGAQLMQPGLQTGQNSQSLFASAMNRSPEASRARAMAEATGDRSQGLVDAATRDAQRALTEQTLPGIQQGITATGNRNSSRAGAAEAVARRGTADMIADTSSQIRQSMYDTALTDDYRRQVSADQLALGANSQLGTSLDRGLGLQTTGLGAQSGLNNELLRAGQYQQGQNQAEMGAARARFDDQRFDGFNVLDRYNQGIGGPIQTGASTSGNPDVGGAIGAASPLIAGISSIFGRKKGPATSLDAR